MRGQQDAVLRRVSYEKRRPLYVDVVVQDNFLRKQGNSLLDLTSCGTIWNAMFSYREDISRRRLRTYLRHEIRHSLDGTARLDILWRCRQGVGNRREGHAPLRRHVANLVQREAGERNGLAKKTWQAIRFTSHRTTKTRGGSNTEGKTRKTTVKDNTFLVNHHSKTVGRHSCPHKEHSPPCPAQVK